MFFWFFLETSSLVLGSPNTALNSQYTTSAGTAFTLEALSAGNIPLSGTYFPLYLPYDGSSVGQRTEDRGKKQEWEVGHLIHSTENQASIST